MGPIWGGFVTGRAGWGAACWSLGVWSGVSVVPAVLFTGGWIWGSGGKRGDGEGGMVE